MASRRPRPGRHLIVFFLGLAVLYGLTALSQAGVKDPETPWRPALGLDLQGGTRITLTAEKTPTKENLDEARRIIDQRVNGSGVAEAAVTTQGGRNIVVEVPGKTKNRSQLEETVKRQAQLRFRLVACSDQRPGACETSTAGVGDPSGMGLGRAPLSLAEDDPTDGATDAPTDGATETATDTATGTPATDGPTDAPADVPTGTPTADDPGGDGKTWTVQDDIAWSRSPDQAAIAEFGKYTCDAKGVLLDAEGKAADLADDPDQPLVSCSQPEGGISIKYLLSRSVVEGTELDNAAAGTPQNGVGWEVQIEMGNSKDRAHPKGSAGASSDFEAVSRAFNGTDEQFAIVLDAVTISAPVMNAVITDGRSSISGDFTEQQALDLANSLKFGALPIKFNDDQTSVEEIGPSLAGNQLSAGLTAGAIGLVLVMLYCLFYYRGLGLVVVSSLFVAAAITYALVLLLSKTAGFTLTLPGIAGLVIAVGITADSFVIFFERIRDEMREGKSMRVAVETGWARARVTRVAANTVQILSALVLYIFASGAVKGFGFALGLTTLIDLAVLFWFTKPMVSWLAQFKAFNSGHKLSGLSKETLGMDITPSRPGRTAVAGGDA
ncbi:protein translocase subunit SecD [Nocardioides daeguensis]|uniref:Protein translocase subunit SecD n=1 Tax=Nocardioides daeguensis TaxID=908359 RepID=A0ABP6VZJ5_9ACTN|nr:protein translocase subunit SecD [Nocardioides daeguensis]MBV6726854.1 protein translocase subunit SecD [Nocardioides daeguensis]MCR1774394.1 protein translocase subunit SecD [Nocardioides daeguensis]